MTARSLRFATDSDYEHTRDVQRGAVPIKGVSAIDWKEIPLLDMFTRQDEWDLAEVSFGKYCELIDSGDEALSAVPVFQSRAFRHTAFYVRRDSSTRSLNDLNGARIGVPDWSQTAVIYARGMLAHGYGIDLRSITWIQGGINAPSTNTFMRLPDGFDGCISQERSLHDLLRSGDLDAVISAVAPKDFDPDGAGEIRWLCPDPFAEERAYYANSGIYPLMHVLAARRELLIDNPSLSSALCDAFDAAATNSIERLVDFANPYTPLPWLAEVVNSRRALLGDDLWPSGVDANRKSIDAFLLYSYEQGVSSRHLTCEQLFA